MTAGKSQNDLLYPEWWAARWLRMRLAALMSAKAGHVIYCDLKRWFWGVVRLSMVVPNLCCNDWGYDIGVMQGLLTLLWFHESRNIIWKITLLWKILQMIHTNWYGIKIVVPGMATWLIFPTGTGHTVCATSNAYQSKAGRWPVFF